MKKLILLLLLFTGLANAQIVNIPDANFKARLISSGIDTNSDGEIQVSEANLVKGILELSDSSINDISGINAFQNITKLKCNNNQITTILLDLPNLIEIHLYNNLIDSFTLLNTNNLTILNIGKNQLTNLDLSNLSNLTSLICSQNQLTNLDFSTLINLQGLSSSSAIGIANLTNLKSLSILGNSQITSLNLVLLVNLESLQVGNCSIGSLDLSTLVNLIYLDCGNNNLNNLNVSTLVNLKTLRCFNNNISSLDLSSLTSLESITIPGNQLLSLNLTGLVNLKYLYCAYNLFTTLDVSSLINLEDFRYGNINLNIVDVSNMASLQTIAYYFGNQLPIGIESLPNLTEFQINSTTFTTLDISNLLHINTFWAAYNPDLTYINLKNGSSTGLTTILTNTNPNLIYFCANDIDIQKVYDGNLFDNGNFQVNSYCNFTPAGNYNTISGNLKLDSNNNGCDSNDFQLPNIRININDGTDNGSSFSINSGDYKFYTQAGSFDITPAVENPSFFNFSPTSATIPFANNNNNTATQDFCITANGNHPDLEVVLAPITPARPGFDSTYQLVYKNKGNQTLSGNVNLLFDDGKTDFVSATLAVDNLDVNSLTWNYTNLLPFESRAISIVLNVNSPVETPSVNIGDVMNFTATINPISGDELPNDNTFVYNQIVVGSFDPNDITCLEGNSVAPSEIGEYLHYIINFENTGNYPSENVVVKTVVDVTKFDINSLQLLNTSHPVDARINGNVVEFIFKNVQLAGPGGHGHVLLKMKSKTTLVAGDSVANRGDIYFDYNAPVDTGLATTIFQSLSNSIFEKDASVSVAPNPTSGNININSNFNVKSIEIYDVQGRILQTILNANKLDISEKAKGIYFLKITTEKGSKIEKLVKD